MDFKIIEGLTDEEINKLYDDDVLQNSNTDYASTCECKRYTNPQVIWFGTHLWAGFMGCSTHGHESCGYCGLQLKTKESCNNWCTSMDFVPEGYFTDFCTCLKSDGGFYYSYWTLCYR